MPGDNHSGHGSDGDFSAVYIEHVDSIYGFIARRVGADLAEDLTAQVFLEALARHDRYAPERGPMGPWLFGIAVNLLRGQCRQEMRALRAVAGRVGSALLAGDHDEERIDGRVGAEGRWPEIAGALLNMDSGERDALLLYVWADLTYRAVAGVLDVPLGTVETRISRARGRLRAALTDLSPNDNISHVFDLLRTFRADEARMDVAIRSRVWAGISERHPEASFWLDTLDRRARVRQLRRRAPRPAQIIAVAAVLLLLAAVQQAVRAGPSNQQFVSAGPSTTVPVPHDLDALADRVAITPVTALGETEDTRYSYRRGVRVFQLEPTLEVETLVEHRWVALDGSGREVVDVEGDARDRDLTTDEAGTYEMGSLTPAAAVALPDDAVAVLARFTREPGLGSPDAEIALALIDLLAYAGLPGPARAGALRALDRLGFEPALGPDPAPNLWRVEGPGPDGSTMRVDFDRRTGEVTAWTRLLAGGGFIRCTNIESDLRDNRGP